MTTTLALLTFNCAKALQSAADFHRMTASLLNGTAADDANSHGHPASSNPVASPDIVVLGLQEVAPILDGCFNDIDHYLQPIKAGVQSAIAAHNLSATSEAGDGSGDCYKLIAEVNAGALALLVYINTQSLTLDHLAHAATRCGYFMSNLKGAVGCRVSLKSNEGAISEWTFVTAHLAANEGEDNLTRRNVDFKTIATSLDFDDGYGLYKPDAHTFLIGDLNYRATRGNGSTPTSPEVADELIHILKSGNIYKQLQEANIHFKPTYKFTLQGDRVYDNRRIPSWCDRILYRTYNNREAILSYDSIEGIVSSDHIPVILTLTVPTLRQGEVEIEIAEEVSDALLPFSADIYPLDPYRGLWSSAGTFSDNIIGWGLYLGTTKRGRLWSGLIVTILCAWITLF